MVVSGSVQDLSNRTSTEDLKWPARRHCKRARPRLLHHLGALPLLAGMDAFGLGLHAKGATPLVGAQPRGPDGPG